MRRSATIAAASIAALAWTVPAAGQPVHYTITFQGTLSGAQTPSSGSAAKVDSFAVKQNVKPLNVKLEPVYVKSWSTGGAAKPSDGPMFKVHDDKDAGIRTGINRLIIATTATAGCTPGKHYPSATMQGGGKSYEFTDVTVTDCAAESMSLSYGKVVVRGWDPKKKEE